MKKLSEVAPPGWGHTKAEKEKTKPDKPKSKIGGSAAAFKRALDDGRFKGLPGDKTKKEKTASMFKLMWSMKKKGAKPHYKPGTDEKKEKYQDESFEIDKSEHKKVQKKAKLRNLAKGNMNPNEKAAAEKKAGGPKLAFEDWKGYFGKEPDIEGAIEYFYEEGLNEEGIDLLIEEIGLESFIDFVEDGTVELNEERAARKMNVRTLKTLKTKTIPAGKEAEAKRKKEGKGEYSAAYKKKETDVTVYDDKPAAKKKAPVKKTVAKKAAPKPVAVKKPVTKKVVKAVAKVKKTQPVKKPSKQGLGDKIRGAYKAGVKRHRKATQVPRVFAKGVKAGAKKAIKFAKDVKKVVSEELTFEGWKEKATSAVKKALKKKDAPKHDYGRDAGSEAKKKLKDKEHQKYVNFLDAPDN